MFKKIVAVLVVQMVLGNSAFAFGIKLKNKFVFNDSEGARIASLSCTNLSMQELAALNALIKRSGNGEVAVEALILKNQRLSVISIGSNGRSSFALDSKKAQCELSIR